MDRKFKQDTLYFVSIILAYLVITLTDGNCLQLFFGLPTDQLEIYLMIFSFFLIVNSSLNRWLLPPNPQEDKNKAQHDILLINSEEYLIIGLVNISSLAYARANHPQICDYSRITHVLLWLLIAGVLTSIGSFTNRATGWNSFTTFGNAMSLFTTAVSIGLASGVDSFLFL